jgi:transcriptional regulator GlxA family with amidase domain
MFEKAKQGILFSIATAQLVEKRISELGSKEGFFSVLELMSILNILSNSKDMQLLSDASFSNVNKSYNSRRVEKVIEYLNQHYDKPISLTEVATIANMTEVSFSRFFKANTGTGFINSLLEIRLGHASRFLIDTNLPIGDIAFNCGFNNISNFNRLFKKRKNCTPKDFREDYSHGNRVFI